MKVKRKADTAAENNRRPLRIAMLGHKVVPGRRGGIELVLTTLCPLLVERGHEVTCFNRAGDKVENEYVGTVQNGQYKGVKLFTVPAYQKRGLAAASSSFFAAIRAAIGHYDIIHFHAEGSGVMMWIPKMFGKRCVATVHGLDWQRDKWKGGPGSRYILAGERSIVRHADCIIVLSRGVQEYFWKTYHRKTVFIPNGVNKPVVRPAQIIKEKYGLEKDNNFLLLSRLTEEKGVHYLIEAYKELDAEGKTGGKKLVIAGAESDTPDYWNHIHNLAQNNPNIIFTGFVSGAELDELYSNCYVYCIPSNLEGMPLGLLEAMSYGNAVIGSDIDEIAEVVEDKALLFHKGDVCDLKRRMLELLEHPETVEKMRAESGSFILLKYNWDEVADKTIEQYYRALQM